MGDEVTQLEEAKADALAAFAAIAAIIDLVGEAGPGEGHGPAVNALRDAAVRHLSAALEVLSRGREAAGDRV